MLRHRLEAPPLKSQTLPRMDGQDEDGDTLELPFDLMTVANSCPDLSIIESNDEEPTRELNTGFGSYADGKPQEDEVDGFFFKNSLNPNKIPLGFRRSTSLNSLEADGYPRDSASTVDGNVAGVLQVGAVAKVVGQLEKTLKSDHGRPQNPNDFVRSTQRSSYTGPGFFHKSVSSPSVQCLSNAGSTKNLIQLSQPRQSQPSSKRSFFRRKHKTKGGSHPAVVPQQMNNGKLNGLYGGEEFYSDSLGYMGLSDPSLALQEPDIECWTGFMGPEVVSKLTEKEVKRQEHMYELIQTEKHHCLTLALMHHLFVGGMKNSGYRRQARILFPGLADLLQVHFDFLRRLKEKQLKFKAVDQPLDTLADVLVDQFSGIQWKMMVRLYGLLCSSLEKSFETFKVMKQKDTKFAALVAGWGKEPLLGRKNVSECLLLVGQRITKYPLLLEPLLKTSTCDQEKSELNLALTRSRSLNAAVNERVAERERLSEICQKIEVKSIIVDGSKRLRREDLLSVPNRRLLFQKPALVNCHHNSASVCNVMVLTDCIVFVQEISGSLHFASPPGMLMLNHLIVRENATNNCSLFLVLVTGSNKPEMIELRFGSGADCAQWMEAMKNAKVKWEEEADLCSDADDELTESMEILDMKASRASEELQEQDRKILSLLKSRSKIIEGLRSAKPHQWTTNYFEGKDDVLNAISVAASEVQRTLQQMESSPNGVNRSASCVSGHVTSGSGLPRRADTFGGFDSQQRAAVDFNQGVNSKVLFQMVVQLADVCGELFQQLVPNLTPSAYQSHHQFQRRMEELREAQQRLEAEKAHWQQEFTLQKEEADRQKAELLAYKESLQKQEMDISQQREQLYRKLEKLETQGIRPYLDSVSVSPLSVNTNLEKIPISMATRRSPSQSSLVQPVASVNSSSSASTKLTKQQLPLHLASSLSKSGSMSSANIVPGSESARQIPRTSSVNFPTKPAVGNSTHVPQPSNDLSRNSSINHGNRTSIRGSSGSASQSSGSGIQQMLPLRLSEGLSARTSSLPRGLQSKSATNVLAQVSPQGGSQSSDNQQHRGSRNSHFLHYSKSSGSLLGGNDQAQSSYLYGPSSNDRMSNYYKDSPPDAYRSQASNGSGDYPNVYTNLPSGTAGNSKTNVPILHRRSGSSPVPMSSYVQNPGTNPYNQLYHQNEDDSDSTRVLFL